MTRVAKELALATGRRCFLSQPEIPGVADYYVLAADETHGPASSKEIYELSVLAQRVGRALARRQHGDPECYSIIYNAGRTRRSPWPHFHIFMARSTAEKRRAFFFLQLKHILRWRRWPLVRLLARIA